MAGVAAVNPVVELVAVKSFEAASVFDGQVGDALARVDAERGLQSPCGTGIYALRAVSAAVGHDMAGFGQVQG